MVTSDHLSNVISIERMDAVKLGESCNEHQIYLNNNVKTHLVRIATQKSYLQVAHDVGDQMITCDDPIVSDGITTLRYVLTGWPENDLERWIETEINLFEVHTFWWKNAPMAKGDYVMKLDVFAHMSQSIYENYEAMLIMEKMKQ